MPRKTGHADKRPAKRPPGRQPVIADAARVATFLDAIRAGVPVGPACHHAGIHPASHYRAIQAAEDADQLLAAAEDAGQPTPTLPERARAYREYRDEFERARAAVAVAHVALVARAARGGQVIRETTRTDPDGSTTHEVERARPEWKASQWLLSVSFREEFGREDRRRVELTGADGGPIEHAGPGEDALSAIAERMAQVAEERRRQLPGGWEPPAAIESTRVDRESLDVDGGSEPLDVDVLDDGPAA